MKDLQELARFEDRVSYLYLEKGHIEQHLQSVAYVTEKETVPIPAADLALLMLGPGTTITHAAIHNLADCNCLVAWCGEEGIRFYCHGRGGTYHAGNLLHQVNVYCDHKARGQVVHRMYEKRFGELIGPGFTLEQIRGREGYRVREAYRKAAQQFGVVWKGREYDADDWNSADPLNRRCRPPTPACTASFTRPFSPRATRPPSVSSTRARRCRSSTTLPICTRWT